MKTKIAIIAIVASVAVAAVVVHTTGMCPGKACMKAAQK
jgi:hypothetical protein